MTSFQEKTKIEDTVAVNPALSISAAAMARTK